MRTTETGQNQSMSTSVTPRQAPPIDTLGCLESLFLTNHLRKCIAGLDSKQRVQGGEIALKLEVERLKAELGRALAENERLRRGGVGAGVLRTMALADVADQEEITTPSSTGRTYDPLWPKRPACVPKLIIPQQHVVPKIALGNANSHAAIEAALARAAAKKAAAKKAAEAAAAAGGGGVATTPPPSGLSLLEREREGSLVSVYMSEEMAMVPDGEGSGGPQQPHAHSSPPPRAAKQPAQSPMWQPTFAPPGGGAAARAEATTPARVPGSRPAVVPMLNLPNPATAADAVPNAQSPGGAEPSAGTTTRRLGLSTFRSVASSMASATYRRMRRKKGARPAPLPPPQCSPPLQQGGGTREVGAAHAGPLPPMGLPPSSSNQLVSGSCAGGLPLGGKGGARPGLPPAGGAGMGHLDVGIPPPPYCSAARPASPDVGAWPELVLDA